MSIHSGKCRICEGTGKVRQGIDWDAMPAERKSEYEKTQKTTYNRCTSCNGSGTCPLCKGQGCASCY